MVRQVKQIRGAGQNDLATMRLARFVLMEGKHLPAGFHALNTIRLSVGLCLIFQITSWS